MKENPNETCFKGILRVFRFPQPEPIPAPKGNGPTDGVALATRQEGCDKKEELGWDYGSKICKERVVGKCRMKENTNETWFKGIFL